MKKLIALCIVTTVVTSVTGCGCCRRLRDFVCRGSRCGLTAPVAAPAPIAAPPVVPVAPMAAAPMMCDPGCGYAGFDPGCGYSGPATYGYGGVPMDTGWMPAGPACESCSGGYTMPAYDGGYTVEPGVPATTVDPGPATVQ